jgi:hypothetical protein
VLAGLGGGSAATLREACQGGAMADGVKVGSLIYRLGAISNFVVTIPAFVVYDRYVRLFSVASPRYPFLVWIWSGMAFLWGVMFWEISRDLLAKHAMIKYTYLEKAVTSTSVVVAYLWGNVPARFLLGIIITDIVWIPIFIWIHWVVASARKSNLAV